MAVSASALATVGVTSAKIGASCAAAGAGAHAVGWTSVGLAFVAIGLAACTLGLALPKEKSHSFSEKLSKLLIIFFYIGTLLSALSLVLYYLYGENPYIMNICRYLVFIALCSTPGGFVILYRGTIKPLSNLLTKKAKVEIESKTATLYSPFTYAILIGIMSALPISVLTVATLLGAMPMLSEMIVYLLSEEPLQFITLFLIISAIMGSSIMFFASIVVTILIRRQYGIKDSVTIVKLVDADEAYKGFLGMVMGTFFTQLVLLSPKLKDKGEEMIRAHELGHVAGHHVSKTLFLISIPLGSLPLLFSMPFFNISIPTRQLNYFLALMFILFLVVFTIFILRIGEIQADLNSYKILGQDAYNSFLEIIKAHYGVDAPEKIPFSSRLTHTSRRDITLTTGDPIAALTHWEIPLVFSLLSADIGLITTYLILKNIDVELSLFLSIIFYSSFLLTNFILSFLLALIIRPIVSRFSSLTDRGRLNLSLMISSIYVVSANIMLLLFLVSPLTMLITLPASYLLILLTVWYFIRERRRSIIIASGSFALFMLVNILLIVSRTFIKL